jgi:hypothetical protein
MWWANRDKKIAPGGEPGAHGESLSGIARPGVLTRKCTHDTNTLAPSCQNCAGEPRNLCAESPS